MQKGGWTRGVCFVVNGICDWGWVYTPERFAISPRSQIKRNFIDKASALLAL